MIADHIKNAGAYRNVDPRLRKALDYLAATDFTKLPPGRYEIDGDRIFALVQDYGTKPRAGAAWEAHRRYTDVQYIVSGHETIGYASLETLQISEPYSIEKDCVLLDGEGDFMVAGPGMFFVFYPQDAHMPGRIHTAPESVRKVVVKVAADNRTQELYRRAKKRIPGGTQLLSKRPEMMAPEQWPPYFSAARGCETWDLEGRRYYDFSTGGIGSCLLGFRDPDVTRAVRQRLDMGSMSSLNPPEEVELADLLCEIHPWAEQARFARCGGEVCAVAARIVRATTKRSVIAVCGYSGWQDWYLAANLGDNDALRGHLLPGLNPLGVPGELRGTTVTFPYNDRTAFQAMLDRYGERLAAVFMEPCRSQDPEPGFLEEVRDGAHRVGALLVFDEITIGWRLHYGGAHLKFAVAPDLAVFAKALGNGHPIAAVIGTCAAMSGAHDSFISSTYWTESIGPVAALATLRKMRDIDLPRRLAAAGARVMDLWSAASVRHGLKLKVGGYPCLPHFVFDYEQADVLRTLFTQLMLERGFLAGTKLYVTLAHTDELIEKYGHAIEQVFAEIAAVLQRGGATAACLRGPVAHSGFRRLIQ